MWQQQSFKDGEAGPKLYLVPTPIGNLEDMSFRAIRIMKEADVIAAEDTRNTKKLCNYFEIDTPVISYHEHNKQQSGKQLIERIENGQTVALVSDAGMPCISDPGYELVLEALEKQITVIPLPGANAALTSLVASGLVPQPFYFYGFLDRGTKGKKKELEKLKYVTSTFVLYESPHRLKETLQVMLQILGNRKFEEFIRGDLESACHWAKENEMRGEFCIIVEGGSEEEKSQEEQWWQELSIVDHVNIYIEEKGLTSKDAIKQAAKDRNVHKREIYHLYHVE